MPTFDESLEKFFKEADVDKSGCVSRLELCKILDKCGYFKEKDDSKRADKTCELFAELDKNKDDKITLEELKIALGKRPPEDVKESEYRACFNKFDKDKSGFISTDELQCVLKEMGYKGDATKILQAIDVNKDGKIAFEEFLKEMRKDCKK